MNFNDLNEEKKSLFNLDSIKFILDMMNDLDIKNLYFNGGALLNQNKLKNKYEIYDWDIHLISGENGTNEIFNKLKKVAEKLKGFEREGTASSLKSLIFYYLGRKIDFQIKKDLYLPEENCTFDIDSICIILKKNETNFYIQNSQALEAFNTGIIKLQAPQSDLYRIIRRILTIIGKYNIKKFIIENDKEIILNQDNSKVIEELYNQEKRNNIEILKKTDKTKASCIIKFFCMCFRVKDLYNYIKIILNSHLFDKIFPELALAMKNNKFLQEIKKESEAKENDRVINSQKDIFELLVKYNENNIKLFEELLIIKNSEFNEVNLDKIEKIKCKLSK